MDLRAFVLRSRAIGLYRSALRVCKRAPQASQEELKKGVREEMERNRFATDATAIRYYISDGLQRLKELETMLSIQRPP